MVITYTRSVPKVMRMIFLRSAEGPGKESGGRGRWRMNPGIQFPQLSPCLCSSRYDSTVPISFCVLSLAKMQMSLEQHYAIKFCAKLGKCDSETMQLLRTAIWGCCFVFSPSPQVAQGVQGRKGER